jgi:hypothetical protein
MAKSPRGRKREITLRTHKDGRVEVVKNWSGMDVVIVDTAKGTTEVLTPRALLILEREAGGRIVTKEVPPDTKITVIEAEKEATDGNTDGV